MIKYADKKLVLPKNSLICPNLLLILLPFYGSFLLIFSVSTRFFLFLFSPPLLCIHWNGLSRDTTYLSSFISPPFFFPNYLFDLPLPFFPLANQSIPIEVFYPPSFFFPLDLCRKYWNLFPCIQFLNFFSEGIPLLLYSKPSSGTLSTYTLISLLFCSFQALVHTVFSPQDGPPPDLSGFFLSHTSGIGVFQFLLLLLRANFSPTQ